MQRFSPQAQGAIVVLLCAVAGFVDAIAYLRGDLFVANMTGNTVLAGISLAHTDWTNAAFRVETIGAFFGGAVLGRLMLTAARGRQWPALTLEMLLIATATMVGPAWLWVGLLAMAMGLQSTAATQFGGMAINTVVVTSALSRMAERLADGVHSRPEAVTPSVPLQGGFQAAAWASYLLGASLAAMVNGFSSVLLFPVAGLAVLVVRLIQRD